MLNFLLEKRVIKKNIEIDDFKERIDIISIFDNLRNVSLEDLAMIYNIKIYPIILRKRWLLMIRSFFVVDTNVSKETISIVEQMKLEVDVEIYDLILLKSYFSEKNFEEIKKNLTNFKEFCNKYLEYAEKYGINFERNVREVFDKTKTLFQNSEFFKETIKYKDDTGEELEYEISRIILDLKKRIKCTLQKINTLEEKAQMDILDIAKKVGYNKELILDDVISMIAQ